MSIRTTQEPGSSLPPKARPRTGSPSRVPGPPGTQIAAPEAVARALEAWFAASARDLPWRRARDGYSALVSEMMLQQTQAQRVAPAFERFMARFSTVQTLAAAPEQDVLTAWQGLGYYRRARHLHAAAQAIVERHGGAVPEDASALRELPGIGRYTAGSIASIVFGKREPIVDGNVFRVLSRLAARSGRSGEPASDEWAWQQAEQLVRSAPNPGATNEALMELGATVCTPVAPKCASCPLASHCTARTHANPDAFPLPKVPAQRQTVHWHALVHTDARGVLLEQRGDSGLWARMWQPPTVEAPAQLDARALAARWSQPVRLVAEFTHTTSHRQVVFHVHVPNDGCAAGQGAPHAVWIPLAQLHDVPLANAAWRVLQAAGVPVSPPPSAAGPRRANRGGPRVAETGS